MNFESFMMNSVIGAIELTRAEKAAQAAAEAKIAEEERAFERQLRLESYKQDVTDLAAEQERLRTLKATEAQKEAMDSEALKINLARGFRFDEEGKITFAPKGQKLIRPKFDLKGFNEFEISLKDKKLKDGESISMNTPFAGLITEPKEQEPFAFPLNMSIADFRKKMANREIIPEYGTDVVGPILRTGGTRMEASNMEAVRDFTFREGWLDKFLQEKKEKGTSENYDRLITLWTNTWDTFSETSAVRQTTEDGIVRVETILNYIPEEYRDVLVRSPEFMDKVVMPTVSQSLGITKDQVFAELGLPAGGPADINEEGQIEVDVTEYANLSWAVDKKTGGYSGDFQTKMADIASSAGLTNSDAYRLINKLGTTKSQRFLNNFTAAREWFAKNEPFVVENNMVRLDGSRMAPPNVDVGAMLANFADPSDRMKMAKAILGKDVIEGIPGITEGGKISARQRISQDVMRKDIVDISKMEASATNIISDTSSLITLIDSKMVEGGLAGVVKTKGNALVSQAEKIMRRINFAALPTEGVSSADLDARRQAQASIQDALADISKGEIAAEKLYNALTSSLMYGVASMLQGGDFRNISDQDIVLAGGRIGNLMDLLNDPETARPVLEQLREQAQFQLETTQAFVRGNIQDIAAATLLMQYRGRNPQNPLDFINIYYGESAGRNKVIVPTEGADSGNLPTAEDD